MSAGDKRISLEQLRGKKIFAFCGIANPEPFFETINRLGANLVGSKIYDDHHHYAAKDVSAIYGEATKSGAGMLLTTEKDYSKIGLPAKNAQLVLAYLAVKLKFISGQNQITQLIERSLTGRIREK
jgi:tetraacyldisaccharide 4'-kinase